MELGRVRVNKKKKDAAKEKYNTPGPPPLVANHDVWKCEGVCENDNMYGMKCVAGMNLSSFYGVSELTVFK